MMLGTGVRVERPSAPRMHLAHVEGMRAAAALVVYVNHAYAQTWNPTRQQFPTGVWSALSYSLVAGHLSVTIFIVISGFCLTLPVVSTGELRGGTADFFKRRARRILPPYYGALGLSLLLIATILGQPTGTLWDVPILVTRVSVVSHLLLLQDLFATGSVNYVFWSIAVEWQIYFFFPLLVWSWRRYGPAVTVSTALAVGYALRFGLGDTRVARANPHYLGMFALGMLAAHVAQSSREPYPKARKEFPWGWVLAVSALAAVAMTLAWGVLLSTERFEFIDLPIGLLTTSLLVVTSRQGNPLKSIFSWKPLAALGTFSYSLYLIHAPLLQILWQYVAHPLGLGPEAMFTFLMTVGLLVVIGGAYLFFLVFERPFMKTQSARVPAVTGATS